jgi:hypothetical protein
MNVEKVSRTLRLGPGQVYTAWCRRACDGAVVELMVHNGAEGLVIESAFLREVHDIGVVGLKTDRETAWFLKRCVRAIETEGLLLIIDGEVHTIPPANVDTSKVAYQQYLSPNETAGPFRR